MTLDARLAAPVCLAALVLATCAGSDHCAGASALPSGDLGADGQVSVQDSSTETGPDSGTNDGPVPGSDSSPDAVPDAAPATCSAKTADGLHLNPGCDPDVQTKGVDAVDPVSLGGGSTWLIVAGKKWWKLDMAKGSFIDGGKDVAAFFRSLKP